MRSGVFRRALIVAVLVWLTSLTAVRDLLHNHQGLEERPNCPACRVERATSSTIQAVATLVCLPTLEVTGPVVVVIGPVYLSDGVSLEPPPRSPPV